LAGPFFYNRTDRVFFQSLGKKNKKQKFVTRNPAARGHVFTEPWATPPSAGAMKIERGVVYNPIIHHGYLLEKIVILGATSHGLYRRL